MAGEIVDCECGSPQVLGEDAARHAKNVQEFGRLVTSLQRSVSVLGTSKDDSRFRSRLADNFKFAAQRRTELKQGFNSRVCSPKAGEEKSIMKTAVAFVELEREFCAAKRMYEDKKSLHPTAVVYSATPMALEANLSPPRGRSELRIDMDGFQDSVADMGSGDGSDLEAGVEMQVVDRRGSAATKADEAMVAKPATNRRRRTICLIVCISVTVVVIVAGIVVLLVVPNKVSKKN